MPPHQQKKKKVGRAEKCRLRRARIAQMEQQAAAAAGATQTQSTQATQPLLQEDYDQDEPSYSSVDLLDGSTVGLRTSPDPCLGRFHFRVTLRMVSKHAKDGYDSREYIKHYYNEDGASFGADMSPAGAFDIVEQMIEDQYMNRSAKVSVTVVPDYAAGYGQPYDLGSEGAGSYEATPATQRVLRVGAPVIDQSITLAKPGYATPASYMAVENNECFARAVAEVLTSRAQHGGLMRLQTCTPEAKRQKTAGARYSTLEDIVKQLDEWYPDRSDDGLPGGVTVDQIDDYCARLKLHLIAFDRVGRILRNSDHRTPAAIKSHSRPQALIIVAAHEHVYMLKDCDEARRIINSVAKLVQHHSPGGKRDPSVVVGRFVKPNASDLASSGLTIDASGRIVPLEDTRPIIRIDDEVPEFEDMEPGIYVMSQRQVVEQYDKFVRTCGLPSFRYVRMEETVLREFSVFKDEKNLAGKITLHSTGSHIRPELYTELVRRMFQSVFSSEKMQESGRRFGYLHMSNGPGALVAKMMREIMGARQIPSAETKRRVLAKQNNLCFDCSSAFMTAEFAKDDDELEEGVIRPCWEHVRAVKAGGMEATEKNIVAVCIGCMLNKNARERTENYYRGADRLFTSTLNAAVMEQVYEYGQPPASRQFDTWAKMITYKTDVPEGEIGVAIDLKKSRRFQLCGELAHNGFAIYTVVDQFLPFDGDASKLGIYRVETKDASLFHGCGMYGTFLVNVGLSYGLITLSDIKEMLRPTRVLPRDTFQSIIREQEEHIVAAYEQLKAEGKDPDELKENLKQLLKDFGGNMQVGVFGRARKSSYKMFTTLDYDEAMEMASRPGACSLEPTNSCGHDAWTVVSVEHGVADGWVRNLYNTVVEGERAMAFVMARQFEAMGGTVMYIKTDEVGGHIPPEKWRPSEWTEQTYEHVGAWFDSATHKQTGKPLMFSVKELGSLKGRRTELCRERPPAHRLPRRIAQAWPDVLPSAPVTPWTIAAGTTPPPPPVNPTAPSIPTSIGRLDEKSTPELARTIVDEDASVFITGEGGSGKTFLTREGIVPYLVERGFPFHIATPTLVTREAFRTHPQCREHTTTLQMLVSKYNASPDWFLSSLRIAADKPFYFIVDEVSMVNEGMWEMMCVLKFTRPQVRFILIGDFGQLPPVMDDLLHVLDGGARTATYENSAVMLDLAGGNRLVMTHSHRLVKGEESHRAASLAVRRGEEIGLDDYAVKQEVTLTNLCYTNAMVKKINKRVDDHFRAQHPEHTPVYVAAAETRNRKKKKKTEKKPANDENAAPQTPPREQPAPATTPVTQEASRKKKSTEVWLIPGTRLIGIESGGGRPEGGLHDEYNIYNRARYVIVAVTEKELTLETLDLETPRRCTIPQQGATRLLTLGWAMTFYCVQGMSLDETYTIFEWYHACTDSTARYVAMTRARRGAQVQIDASDKFYDSLRPVTELVSRPSLMSARKEYIDAEAWEDLCMRAEAELEAESDGLAYFARFKAGVRGECDGDERAYYVKTRYVTTTGRRTARTDGPGISLQQVAKPIQTALLAERGHDLDIRAAHPTLLVQYLAQHSADAPATPHISEYVAAKEAVHARIAAELEAAGHARVSESKIKRAVVRAMFLGKLKGWLRKELRVFGDVQDACPTLSQLAQDFEAAAAFVAAHNPAAVENAKTRHEAQGRQEFANPVAGAVSEVLNRIETSVVAAIEDSFVQESGMAVRVVVYDGLVAHAVDSDVNTIDAEALRLAERRAKEATGYAVELVEKPLYGEGSVQAAMAFLRAYSATGEE